MGESLGWLNATVEGLWPRVDAALQKLIHERVTEQIQEKMPSMFKNTYFPEFTLGSVPPEMGPVKVFEVDNGLKMTVGIAYESDADISLAVGPVSAGISDLRFSGELVVRLEQLLDQLPVVGGVVIHFMDPPKVDFRLTGLTGFPGVRGVVRHALDRAVHDSMVLPNQIAIPLGTDAQGVDRSELLLAKPVGLLRAAPVCATELCSPDWDEAGKEAADAYVVVKTADQLWASDVVVGSQEPEWEGSGNLFVYDLEQRVWAEARDADHAETTDFLGATQDLSVREALAQQGPLTLHPTLHAEDAEDPRGELTMDYRLLKFVPGELCGDRFVLVVRVDAISLPSHLGGRARLTATLSNGLSRSTSLGKEAVRHEGSVAVSELLRDVVRRADAKGLPLEDVAEITALSEDDVSAVLEGGHVEEDAVLAKTRRLVRMDQCLFFSFPAEDLAAPEDADDETEPLSIELSVFGRQGEQLSSVSVLVDPLTEAEHLTVSELFSMCPAGADQGDEVEMIEAKVSLSLMGTMFADDE